jgi:hypothetical protein
MQNVVSRENMSVLGLADLKRFLFGRRQEAESIIPTIPSCKSERHSQIVETASKGLKKDQRQELLTHP